MTTRHGEWTWDFTPEEATGFGVAVSDLSRAIRDLCGAARVYVLGLGEMFVHFHVLVVPRYPDDTEMRIEREVHGALFGVRDELVDDVEADRVATALREILETSEVQE